MSRFQADVAAGLRCEHERRWSDDCSTCGRRGNGALQGLAEEAVSLRAFKAYVHRRLDEAGVPADPEPEENAKHGCRIEGRLNWLVARAKVDGEVFNMGRWEGRGDVGVTLRKLLDPTDANHWSIDGCFAEVERLKTDRRNLESALSLLADMAARVRELRSGLEDAASFIARRSRSEIQRDTHVLSDHLKLVLANDDRSAEKSKGSQPSGSEGSTPSAEGEVRSPAQQGKGEAPSVGGPSTAWGADGSHHGCAYLAKVACSKCGAVEPVVTLPASTVEKAREALEAFEAAVWDRLYGKGPLSKEYAQGVVREVKAALALLPPPTKESK